MHEEGMGMWKPSYSLRFMTTDTIVIMTRKEKDWAMYFINAECGKNNWQHIFTLQV